MQAQKIIPNQNSYFGVTKTYTVDATAASTYTWRVIEGAFAGTINNQGTNSVSVDWGTTPVGGYQLAVVETNPSSPDKKTIFKITIKEPLKVTVSDRTIQQYSSGNIGAKADPTDGHYSYSRNTPGGGVGDVPGHDSGLAEQSNPGDHVVTVTDDCGNRVSIIGTLNLMSNIGVGITASGPTTFCSGGSVVLTADLDPGVAVQHYQWKRNGEDIGSTNCKSYTATESGDYSVAIKTTRNVDAVSPDTKVIVNTLKVIIRDSNGADVGTKITSCESVNLIADATGPADLKYEWKKDGEIITDANSSSYAETENGDYTVTVSSAGSGCPPQSATVTVFTHTPNNVSALLTLDSAVKYDLLYAVDYANSLTLCEEKTGTGIVDVHLRASSSFMKDLKTYQWKKDGDILVSETSNNYEAKEAGIYTVEVTDIYGCAIESYPFFITVDPLPDASIEVVASTTFCDGGTVTLTVREPEKTGFIYQYEWKNKNGVIGGITTNRTYIASESGEYDVTVTRQIDNIPYRKCSATSAVTVTVTKTSLPDASIKPVVTTVCVGDSVILEANATGTPGLTYQWNDSSGLITGETNPSYTATKSGEYTVTVTDGNSPLKCSATTVPAVTVTQIPLPATGDIFHD